MSEALTESFARAAYSAAWDEEPVDWEKIPEHVKEHWRKRTSDLAERFDTAELLRPLEQQRDRAQIDRDRFAAALRDIRRVASDPTSQIQNTWVLAVIDAALGSPVHPSEGTQKP